MVETGAMSLTMTERQFEQISQRLYGLCGINLHMGKEELVKARLAKRLRVLGLRGFDDYMQYLDDDASGSELTVMIDSLTTNKTSFFRESQHFEFLKRNVFPELRSSGGKIRFWSAGCSSGEEPLTLAMLMREELGETDLRDVRILATDISTNVLRKVKEAVYDEDTLADVPAPLVRKYFTLVSGQSQRQYQANNCIRQMVHPARLNLMGPWPMKGPFDVIFCRNVMIYFDKPTQQRLVRRFWELLKPGGYLFVGHSESLTATTHDFRYVEPAVYAK
jgi:chemotaxis protein methyltransferase CheR